MKTWQRLAFFGIILGFVSLSIGSALSESLTFDEIVHRQEGENHWLRQTFAVDTNNPPLVREIATLPLVLGADKLVHSDIQAMKFLPGRLVTILLGELLIILLFGTLKKYLGIKAGLLAAFLLAFQPNFLAHSHYLTLDTGTSLFLFLAYILTLKTIQTKRLKEFVVLGVGLGLALSSRVIALPFLLLILPYVWLMQFKSRVFFWWWRYRWRWGIVIIVVLFTLWASYFFKTDVIIAERRDPQRVSAKLLAQATSENKRWLVALLYFGQFQKIPLGNYLATLKNSLVRSRQSDSFLFLGQWYSHNRWYFLPTNIFLKTPLPFWILVVMGMLTSWRNAKYRRLTVLSLTSAIILLALLSLGNLQPQVRYALPIYPFLTVVAAGTLIGVKGRYGRLGVGVLLVWYLFGTSAQFPHFISFANELAGPKEARFQKFTDSNLDWGQSLPDLVRYIAASDPQHVSFSYFGRDNADPYGLVSQFPYGSYRNEEICAFHEIPRQGGNQGFVAISLTNWYDCGFSQLPQFFQDKIARIVGDSILIFSY